MCGVINVFPLMCADKVADFRGFSLRSFVDFVGKIKDFPQLVRLHDLKT